MKDYKTVLQYYFDLECKLLKDHTRTTEIKAAEAWGVLNTANSMGEIDWNQQRNLFGELISKMLKLR